MTKYIDIEKTLKGMTTGFLRYLPKWIIRIISRIVHEEEINIILNKYSHLSGADFLKALLDEFQITIEAEGLENLPESQKMFFAANHAFGFADGLVLTSIVSKKYGTLKAIANDSFKFIPQLDEFVVAVNVFDGSSKDYLKAIEAVYGQDIAITHFPAGAVSRKSKGIIQDLAWQKSFITKAIAHKRGIVPFHFHGTNSKLFYRINNIRRFFGIKANVELMLLPHEIFLKRGKSIKVTIGKPISWESFDKSKTHLEWAQEVRAVTYNLGK